MFEFYETPLDSPNAKRARKALKILYESIPDTTGCIENIAKPDGCGAWCCKTQSPSAFYCEFSNVWNVIVNSWTKEQILALITRCVENYFASLNQKGCVFWNRETKLCNIHKSRPYNCYIYAQTPDEDFTPRLERLRVLYPECDFHNQCDLVKSVGHKPTKDEVDQWFKELCFIEMDLGIEPKHINDGDGGSYRTFHDHILLQSLTESAIDTITRLKMSGNKLKQEKFIDSIGPEILSDVLLLKRFKG